jgi:hypothetical protein
MAGERTARMVAGDHRILDRNELRRRLEAVARVGTDLDARVVETEEA